MKAALAIMNVLTIWLASIGTAVILVTVVQMQFAQFGTIGHLVHASLGLKAILRLAVKNVSN